MFDLSLIPKKTRQKIVAAYKKLLNQEAEGIFEEIALYPDAIDLDRIKPARRKLDEVVMGEVYGLSILQQEKIYSAVVDMVRSRLDRSDSVGENGNFNNVNLNLIKETILDKIKYGQ